MHERTVDPADAGMRLDQWLVAHAEAASRRKASEWIERGKIFVDGEPVDPRGGAHKLIAGQRVGVWLDRPGSSKAVDRSAVAVRHLLNVIHEDDAIVVIDKPVGLLVEPLPKREGEESTLLDLLADHYRHVPKARVHVVHRIDRDTSGLVLFARTPSAMEILKAQFEARTPERVYQAVVMGVPTPSSGAWRDQLAWDPAATRQRKAHARDARAKDAEARYRVIEAFGDAAVIEVSLVTGKHNQIRVQSAMRGHPLLGERQYRFDAPPEPASMPRIDRQALHAWKLGFMHPKTGSRVTFTSPLPQDLSRLLDALRKRP